MDIITREFLEKALKKEANGSPAPEILSHTTTLGTKPGDNYTSIIYSIEVKLANGKTRHLLAKCYTNDPSRQEYTNISNMFFKECEIYSKWLPELRRFQTQVLGLDKDQVVKLPYAPFVHGECIDFQSEVGEARKSEVIQSLENFIIMEDVRTSGYRMTHRRETLDLDHMLLAVEALAKVHALSWAYRNHVEPNLTETFPCLVSNFGEEVMAIWSVALHANLAHAKGIYDAEFGPENACSAAVDKFKGLVPTMENFYMGKHSGEGFEKLFRISSPDSNKFGKDSEKPEPWRIICHGDCNSNNLLYRYDPETRKPCEVILVDLQMFQETCVINDLQYCIYGSTDFELRRAHTDGLLQLYHDTFNAVCTLLKTPSLPGFNMDSLRFRFHRGKLFGYYMAMLSLPIVEEEKAVSDSKANLKKRIIGLTQGMIEDGVL